MPSKIRSIRVEGNIAYVPLTRGYEAIIDVGDVQLVERWNWHAQVKQRSDGNSAIVYAMRGETVSVNRRVKVYMHRVIAETPEGFETDHIDGNGLNNRRANLRAATREQNGCNQSTSCANTSGAKGVTWNRRLGRWQAQIGFAGKMHYLGLHETVAAASDAYAAKSVELHGIFGRKP